MITPGKWEADEEGEYVFTRVASGLMMVAQMRGWSYLTGGIKPDGRRSSRSAESECAIDGGSSRNV
ncbi:MAG: hypothetical protein IJG36_09175 [Synergistaceae bacterium]|nr:hypothetical protein [Synergistaceae bacterium]MBQ3759129.1 hypothetical protein [Synergistaceae bacterium]